MNFASFRIFFRYQLRIYVPSCIQALKSSYRPLLVKSLFLPFNMMEFYALPTPVYGENVGVTQTSIYWAAWFTSQSTIGTSRWSAFNPLDDCRRVSTPLRQYEVRVFSHWSSRSCRTLARPGRWPANNKGHWISLVFSLLYFFIITMSFRRILVNRWHDFMSNDLVFMKDGLRHVIRIVRKR